MSRIGRAPIAVPAGVDVTIEGNVITVKGPKGTLTRTINPVITAELKDGHINVMRPDDEKTSRSLHGLTRSLISNMVTGVTDGYKKELEVNGVGYRASKEGNRLVLNIGYSHPVIVEEIEGITIDVPNANSMVINGIDKQMVGQFAADVRKLRAPEPYKGKGIKYKEEVIRRKEGKTGAR